MSHVGTLGQMAAMLVAGADCFPGPGFAIVACGQGRWALTLRHQDEWLHLGTARDPATMRVFSSVEAAVRSAQQIAAKAGWGTEHGATGDLCSMPEIRLVL